MKKNKRSVKILSLILVLVMAFSLVPVSASAETYRGGSANTNGWSSWWNWGWGSWWNWGWDDPEPEPEPEPDPVDEVTYPAVVLTSEEVDGLTVTVDAPEGALPEGTEMTVTPVSLDAVQAAVDSTEDVSGTVLAAADISFLFDEEEIQPNGDITVTMTSDTLVDVKNTSVIHLDTSASDLESAKSLVEAESVDGVTVEPESVTFEADHFSVYAVVDKDDQGDYARVQVNFWNIEGDEDELLATVWVKNSDNAEQIEKIVYDPGAGDLATGEFFLGWSKARDYTADSAKLTIDDVRKELLDMNIVEGMDPVNYYATVFKAFSVTYLDENGAAIQTDNVIFKSGDEVSYKIDMDYTPMLQNEDFSGWLLDTGKYNGKIVPWQAKYDNGTTVTLKGNVILTANAPKGFWISFEENPGNQYRGASYTAPEFCVGGSVGAAPQDPTLPGYSFKGWYTDENYTQRFSFSGTIDHDITLYAKWELEDKVPYTVVIWTQKVTDSKAAADNEKTYDYYNSEVLEAAPNTPISSLNLDSYKDLGITGFAFNTTKGVVSADNAVTKVLPNGTTTVYLYYDRELLTYTFQFYDYTYTKVTDPDLSYSYSSYYYRHPNGEYTKVSRGGSDNNYYYYTPLTSFSALEHSSGVNDTYENTWYFFIAGSTTYWVYYSESAGKWVYQSSDGDSGEYTQSIFSSYPANFLVDNNDTFYTSSNYQSWQDYEKMTGLYGQTLAQNGYEWPSTSGYRWFTSNSSNSGFMSYVDTFNLDRPNSSTDDNETIWYGRSQSFDAQTYHFLQNEDGTWTDANLATSNLDSLQNDAADQEVWTALWNYMISYDFYGFHATKRRASVPSGGQYRVITAINNGTPTYDGNWKTTSTGWTEWLDNNVTVAIDDGSNIITPNKISQVPTGPNGVQFLYERNTATVNYLVGGFYTGEGVKLDNVSGTGLLHSSQTYRYQESIDGCADYEPTVPAGYIFAGWFEDASCTKSYDDTGKTMPNDGVTLYAKFVQRQYRVFLRPEPTWSASNEYWQHSDIHWVDGDSQARNYRIDYQAKVNDGDAIFATRPNATLLGWYRTYNNGKFSNPFNFGTAVTDSIGIPYDKTASFNVTEEDGITNKDVNRYWILPKSDANDENHLYGKLDLYAKWRKNLDGAEGITVIYDATDAGHFVIDNQNKQFFEDPIPYGDLAEAMAQAASVANNADGMRFAYWKLLKWNGSAFVDTGETYYPGQTFTVKKDDSHEENLNAGGTQKKYTVMMVAVYVNKTAAAPTHIYWYANNGTEENNGAGARQENKPVDINVGVDIPTLKTFTPAVSNESGEQGLDYANHVFLGWAKVNNDDANDGKPHPELNETNLFLRWVPDTTDAGGHYMAQINGTWKTVTQVAADELTPYQDLYAVWGKIVYVYHSGSKTVERRIITGKNILNLTENISDGYLYGGYYQTYSGASAAYADFASANAKERGWSNMISAMSTDNWSQTKTDTDGTAYAGGKTTWSAATSYTEMDGMHLIPEAGRVYYIKEVPANKYLQPYLHYTYKKGTAQETNLDVDNKILAAWLISDTDDLNYQQTGFVIIDQNKQATDVVNSLTIEAKNTGSTVRLTSKTVFGTAGYLSYLKVINKDNNGENLTAPILAEGNKVLQYWVTPDGLIVTGTTQRVYNKLDSKNNVADNMVPKDVGSTIAVFNSGN